MRKMMCMRLILILFFLVGYPSLVLAVDDDANQKILKDAILGAVTGAVATEATKDEGKKETVSGAVAEAAKTVEAKDHEKKKDKNKHKKKKGKFVKEKKRPYGWDQGKKTGWGDGDEPPGLSKKNKD